MERVICPVCKKSIFNSNYMQKGLYLCEGKNEDESYCGHMLALCKKCNKIFDESNFGKHGDVYECKECGTVCWPLTDKKRDNEQLASLLNAGTSNISRILSELYNR